MRLSRFFALLHRHGAQVEHWPAAEVGAARALLATSADARTALARAERLDHVLRDAVPEPDAERVHRMRRALAAQVARMPLPAQPRAAERWLRPLWPALPAGVGAAAMLAACGLWLALAAPAGRPGAGVVDPLEATQVLALAEIEP